MEDSKIMAFEHMDSADNSLLFEIIETWVEIFEANKSLKTIGESDDIKQNRFYAEGLMKVARSIPVIFLKGESATSKILKEAADIAENDDISKLKDINARFVKVKQLLTQ